MLQVFQFLVITRTGDLSLNVAPVEIEHRESAEKEPHQFRLPARAGLVEQALQMRLGCAAIP